MAEDFKGGESEMTEIIVVVAADHGQLDLVTGILERGEDPNTVNEIGTSALHNAPKRLCLYSAVKASSLLLTSLVSAFLWQTKGPMVHLAALVFLRIYPKLGQVFDRKKAPFFHKAITLGHIEIARVFIEHGTDVERKGKNGNRALHLTVRAMGLCGKSVEATSAMIRFLIDSGTSARSKNSYGHIPDCNINDSKIRTLLRNYMKTQSKGDSTKIASKALAPPPEYKA
ncbi:unnamed protein product [Penicillium pancosmium]